MLIFVSDLDNSMLANHKDFMTSYVKEFNRAWKKIKEKHNACLVYNTGRSLTDFRQNKIFRCLLLPEYIICANGSEIYKIENGRFILDENWDAFLGETYNKKEAVKICNRFDEVISSELSEKVATDRHRHTITISEMQDPQHVLKILKRKLPNYMWILESNVSWLDNNALIDCMPPNCTKGSALDYLINVIQNSFEFHTELDVIWAGDEANDISLTETEYKGILVGNSSERLRAKARPVAHYIAKEFYTRGILEGLRHFGYVQNDLLEDLLPYLAIVGVAAAAFVVVRTLRNSLFGNSSRST